MGDPHIALRSAGSVRLLAASAQPAFMQTGQGVLDMRGPSTQPAFQQAELKGQISIGSVAEPGNPKVEAGSETAGSLAGI